MYDIWYVTQRGCDPEIENHPSKEFCFLYIWTMDLLIPQNIFLPNWLWGCVYHSSRSKPGQAPLVSQQNSESGKIYLTACLSAGPLLEFYTHNQQLWDPHRHSGTFWIFNQSPCYRKDNADLGVHPLVLRPFLILQQMTSFLGSQPGSTTATQTKIKIALGQLTFMEGIPPDLGWQQ